MNYLKMNIMSYLQEASKYLAIMKASWKQCINYKINLLISFFSGSIPLIAGYYLWLAIYSTEDSTISLYYSLPKMLTYIFGAFLLNQLITPFGIEWQIASDISEGKLSRHLLYPFNYIDFCLSKLTAEKLLMCFLRLPIIFLLLYFFSNHLLFSLDTFTYFFILSSVLAYILYSLLSISIGFAAFWFIDVTGFFYIGNTIITLFAGILLPLDLFPKTIFGILKYTPFYYIIYFPLKIFIQEVSISEIFCGYLVQIFWILILYISTNKLFKSGLKKYESFGG